MKKLFTGILVFVLVAGCLSCGGKASGGREAKESDLEFWSAPATEKILQDQPDLYDNIKGEASITVTAARGEYESAQLIMTASEDVAQYDVTVSDLTMQGSDAVFSKDDILLYNEKYIMVVTNYEGNGAPTGMYPDAILPFRPPRPTEKTRLTKAKIKDFISPLTWAATRRRAYIPAPWRSLTIPSVRRYPSR